MAKARLSMRKIKEVLRLKFNCALSGHQIAHSCQISRSTVADYLDRFEKAGLGWPLPQDLSEEDLDKKLFPPWASEPAAEPLPDFDYIYRELKAHKKFNLTLDLLWREYKEQYPEGYQYTQFSVLYRRWQKKLDYSMRQDHRGGEKLFVDYGEGLNLVDSKSGEPIKTQLFVAVWGASNYTFAEATLTQQLPDWIGSHVRAFESFGCLPKIVVPDCLKSAVVRACRYEPDLTPTYAEMARHYGLCVLPARPAHPKDKGKWSQGSDTLRKHRSRDCASRAWRRPKPTSITGNNAGPTRASTAPRNGKWRRCSPRKNRCCCRCRSNPFVITNTASGLCIWTVAWRWRAPITACRRAGSAGS